MKKINLKEIINIETLEQLNKLFSEKDLSESILNGNYLFHYFIMLGNLEGLKLKKFPVYIENNDKLNGFHLCAKEYNFDILKYLIETYPEYIYNRNGSEETFAHYLPISEIPILLKKFPDIDWYDLLENVKHNMIPNILVNLSHNDLLIFLERYKLNFNDRNFYLENIINNNYLKEEQKIKILDKLSDEEINQKNIGDKGLICVVLYNHNEKILDYLLKRNIDINYNFVVPENKSNTCNNPLLIAINNDVYNNINVYTKKILDNIGKNDNAKNILNNIKNSFLDNMLHAVIYMRINYLETTNLEKIDYSVDELILKNSNTDMWNDVNKDNVTSFDLVIDLDYNIYSKFIPKKIKIDVDIQKNLKEKLSNPKFMNDNNKLWLKYISDLDTYKADNDSIIKTYPYSHVTYFSALFVDIGIFMLYLMDTYKNLYIPTLKSYEITYPFYRDGLKFQHYTMSIFQIFPWVISCSLTHDDEIHIHKYLNNLIKSVKDKDFIFVYLSIEIFGTFHANCLIYDLKNRTIERFEPDGGFGSYAYSKIDDALEEELTWDTDFKYIRPNEFLSQTGFQTVSNETADENKKRGDIGGFCLAWCLWYTEMRLKNPDINPSVLVKKAMKNIITSKLKYSEYIRNYSEHINKYRLNILKKLDIDEREITNQYVSNQVFNKILDFVINKFENP